jgi:hypothetical protein
VQADQSRPNLIPQLNRQTIIQTVFAVARGEKLGLSSENRRIHYYAVRTTTVPDHPAGGSPVDIVASLDSR